MEPAKPRTATGRYPRGEETKQRIIDVAVDMFGRQGFAGTSTRDIATAAKVNTPAIQYYFEGKLGLYTACIEQLTGRVSDRTAPAIDACRAAMKAGAGLDEIIAALNAVQSCLIDSFFSDREGNAIRQLLAWEEAENEENSSGQLMKDRIGEPIFEIYRQAVALVVPAPMQQIEIEMHAMSLIGLSIIFHFNQCKAIDMLDWTIDDGMLAMLKTVVHKQLRYALVGLSRANETLVR